MAARARVIGRGTDILHPVRPRQNAGQRQARDGHLFGIARQGCGVNRFARTIRTAIGDQEHIHGRRGLGPFNAAIGNRAPAVGVPPLPPLASEGLPQLVGVVQSQGRGSSAIFQIGGSSSSAAVGETIAGSGWRLRSVAGEGAVIERGGQVHRLSISSGL